MHGAHRRLRRCLRSSRAIEQFRSCSRWRLRHEASLERGRRRMRWLSLAATAAAQAPLSPSGAVNISRTARDQFSAHRARRFVGPRRAGSPAGRCGDQAVEPGIETRAGRDRDQIGTRSAGRSRQHPLRRARVPRRRRPAARQPRRHEGARKQDRGRRGRSGRCGAPSGKGRGRRAQPRAGGNATLAMMLPILLNARELSRFTDSAGPVPIAPPDGAAAGLPARRRCSGRRAMARRRDMGRRPIRRR